MVGVYHLHFSEGHGYPFSGGLHQLQYILCGVKCAEGMSGAENRERKPITPNLLCKIKSVSNSQADTADILMLWAACCLAYFWCMWIGELTVPTEDGHDASTHLSWGDVLVDDLNFFSRIKVHIKASKTDPFCWGISMFTGRVASDLCPITALLPYMMVRSKSEGPPVPVQRWETTD